MIIFFDYVAIRGLQTAKSDHSKHTTEKKAYPVGGERKAVISGKLLLIRSYVPHSNTGKNGKFDVKHLCSDEVNSILRSKDPASLESFTWEKVAIEAKVHAPLTFGLLACISDKPSTVHMIGYVVALLCRLHWSYMNLPQRLVSIILYAGHCSKQVRFYRCIITN